MESLHLAYAASGALAVVLILDSARIRDFPVTTPLIGLVAGAVLGPGLDVLVIPEEHQTILLLEVTRLLLALSLIAVALRFAVRELRPVLRPVVVLVAVGMPLFAAVTAGIAAAALGFPLALAALLGACLSPTDPVLASGVVTGEPAEEVLPERARQVLTEESGANDGLALSLVLLALALVLDHSVAGEAGKVAYQVGVAVALAVPVGYAAGRMTRAVEERDDVERTPELLLTLFLAVAVLGAARLLRADGVLAVFVAGLTYNLAIGDRERDQQDRLDEAFNRFLIIPVFMLFGAVLPFGRWVELGWGAVPFVLGVLLLRRPPIVYALRRVLGLAPIDAAFVGWFGPMGVSALFYVALAQHEGVTDERLFAAGTLAVAVSTVVHGVTSLPARKLYQRHHPDRTARSSTRS